MGITVEQQPAATTAPSVSASSHLALLIALLWRRRSWLAKVSAIGLVIATIIAFTIPKRYQSTAQLMPPDSQSMSNVAMVAAMTGVSVPSASVGGLATALMGNKSPGALFIAILNSRSAQDDLISRFGLLKVYNCKRYKDARKQLAGRSNIEDTKSGTITITVTDTDAYRARDLARGYVEELDRLVAVMSTSSARRERIFLEERLKAVNEDLAAASLELGQFSSRNGTFDVQNQAKAMLDSAARLQGELIAEDSNRRGLETIYSAENARVRAARARVADLRRQLQKMRVGGDETGIEGDQWYPPLSKLPLLGITYVDLVRRVKVQEAMFEILTKQLELAKVQEAREIPTVKVLDAPDLPEWKSFPPRLLFMVIGTGFSFCVGTVWVLGRARWDEMEASVTKAIFEDIAQSARADIQELLSRMRLRRQSLELR